MINLFLSSLKNASSCCRNCIKKQRDQNVSPNKTDVKQLKAMTMKDCDKSTCELEKEDNNRRFSLIEEEIRKESYVKCPILVQASNKNVSSVQNDVFSNGKSLVGNEGSVEFFLNGNKNVTFEGKRKSDIEDQFKIILSGSINNSSSSFTELTETPSGTLTMALDEKVIELIDKKISEDSNITVTLKITESGHLAVDLNAKDIMNDNTYRVIVNRTPSGTRFFKVNKTIASKLQAKCEEDGIEEIIKSSDTTNETNLTKHTEIRKSKKNTKEIYHSGKLIESLMQKYDSTRNINVKVRGENGILMEINVPLIKTLSGNLAFDVKEVLLFNDLLNSAEKRSVVLTKSKSESYDLYLRHVDEISNSVIRKTNSGSVLIVICDPVLKLLDNAKSTPKEEFYKVKIKNADCELNDVPAVLKSTPSQNYVIIIDKEYEKDYKKHITDVLGYDNECYINLSRTDSGNYLINIDNTNNVSSNALFLKSPSGNIRILKNNLVRNSRTRKLSVESTSKVFNKLFNKLPSSKESGRDNCHATKISSAKSSSDSNLYEKIKMLTPNYTELLKNSLESLTETRSGEYAVVLGKESKTTFINNMKSYLKSSPHGRIPVKRTDSGEITILLDANQKEKTHYGSLKITPSGNIFVMVDKNFVKGVKKVSTKNEDKNNNNSITLDTISSHMIGTVKRPVDKAVTTTCNARPDACSCDASKCVCKELQCKTIWNNETENTSKLFHPQMCGIDWRKVKKNPDGTYKICDPSKCIESCCQNVPSRTEIYSKNKLPHIVIKPCACQPTLKNNPHAEEQCFYIETVCPYHKKKSNSVSNDLLEISGLCKKTGENKMKPEILGKDNTSHWDSLRFLPPQLPEFLREFKY